MKFFPNQKVTVVGFPEDDPLEGATGVVTGISYRADPTTFYIVTFEHGIAGEWPSRVIIDSCLKPAIY